MDSNIQKIIKHQEQAEIVKNLIQRLEKHKLFLELLKKSDLLDKIPAWKDYLVEFQEDLSYQIEVDKGLQQFAEEQIRNLKGNEESNNYYQ